jgi:bifunctional UDP-N-acetylglucosamine pyrophosphorylase / glucosamine-1-phosphate N-acetyltransferase
MSSLTAIVLAAGKSTRMKSRRPKALLEVCGKPMLHYILRACYGAGVERILLVVGHGKEEVKDAFGGDKRIHFVEQTEQLGTGHAARMCEPFLKKSHGDVFILAGDVPLVRNDVLTTLHRAHKDYHAAASMATAVLNDPTGYGRVVRDENGEFVKIVEQADCTPQQREIHEVFPSYYCVKTDELLWSLANLKNENKKHEYYLTDIYALLRNAGKKVVAVQAATYEDVLAPNTRQQLADADEVMQERIQNHLRDNGVTIVSANNTYIEDGVTMGRDSVVQPFTFVGRDSSIGPDCCLGPFASIPRESIVPEGTTLAGNIAEHTTILNQRGG